MKNWFWPFFVLVTAYGACVGSFLNVVIYRIPEGKSLWKSASGCPKCGHEIRWWENIPIISWLALRGKCRGCGQRISVHYLLIELLGAGLYAALFYVYYGTGLRPDFSDLGIKGSWPVLVVHLILLGALLSATVIDAKLYIIPLQIPWFATLVALVFLPVSAIWLPQMELLQMPLAGTTSLSNAAFGTVVGLVLSLLLLYFKVLPRSFDDIEAFMSQREQEIQQRQKEAKPCDGLPQPADIIDINDWLTYPHPRREILKECLFLALPITGAIAGYFLVPASAAGRTGMTYPVPVHVLGGVLVGYFVGAALIWGTRILGTLAFGKEAMGLGDVHLLAAIGACIGAKDTAIVFFIAPFMGLAYAAVEVGLTKLLKVRHRPIPYGPHLAVAAFVMMLFREPIYEMLDLYIGL